MTNMDSLMMIKEFSYSTLIRLLNENSVNVSN